MNDRLTRLGRWLLRRSRSERQIWSALLTALTFYGAAFLSEWIEDILKLPTPWIIFLHATVLIFGIAVVIILFRFVAGTIDAVEEEQRQQKAILFDAYSKCDVLLIQRAANLENCDSAEAYARILAAVTQNIQYIVEATYRTFQAAYGRSDLPEERIDFEVTFMTKSFNDGYITIPAAMNKDGRQPRSMLMRHEQPTIYERTKTAELYRLDNPAMLIVSDTTTDPSYAELYVNQKLRIKSSIIFPVLSNKNRLLGTLVVHCDRSGFFLPDKEKFWSGLMEIFAKRVSHEVLALEAMQRLLPTAGTAINIDHGSLQPY